MDKVAVITGTRKGIGRFLVDHYLAQGYRVAGCSRGPMGEHIDNYLHYELDVSDERAAIEMLNSVMGAWGRVDVLLNNAGIASMNHVLLTPLKTVEQIFSTNVFGTFVFAREAAKHMSKGKFGRIVNFATVATPLQLEGEAAYAASKAAVKSYTQIMARELAPLGITVNAVGPTPVDTDLIRGVPKAKMDALLARQAIPRLGTCEDIANVIDFLVDERSDFITGQTVYLGGVS